MHDFIAGVGMAHGERDSGREAGAGEGLGGCRECKDECVSESYSTSVLLNYEIFSFIKKHPKMGSCDSGISHSMESRPLSNTFNFLLLNLYHYSLRCVKFYALKFI